MIAHKYISHFIYELATIDKDYGFKLLPFDGEVCSYCGLPYEYMVSLKEFNLTNYNDWDLHQAPDSNVFCLPCAYIQKEERFRRRDVIVSKEHGVEFLQRKLPEDRQRLIDAIFYQKIKPPFVISLTESYKKHIIRRTQVNYSNEHIFVQQEEVTHIFTPKIHTPIFEMAKELLEQRVYQVEILNNRYSSRTRKKIPDIDEKSKVFAPFISDPVLPTILSFAKPYKK